MRNITFKDEGTRNKFEKLLKIFENVSMVEYDNVDFGDHIFLNSKELIDITIKNSILSKILIMKFKDVLFKIATIKRVSFIGNSVDHYFYEYTFFPERIDIRDNTIGRNNRLGRVLLNIQGNIDSSDRKHTDYTR